MAYGFSNKAILNAIARAYDRGVRVRALLDKSNASNGKAEGRWIEALIDRRAGIHHNKAIVIDHRHVITGSFNFTEAAQKKNRENVLLISNNPPLAGRFAENFAELAEKAQLGDFKPCPSPSSAPSVTRAPYPTTRTVAANLQYGGRRHFA